MSYGYISLTLTVIVNELLETLSLDNSIKQDTSSSNTNEPDRADTKNINFSTGKYSLTLEFSSTLLITNNCVYKRGRASEELGK